MPEIGKRRDKVHAKDTQKVGIYHLPIQKRIYIRLYLHKMYFLAQ